MKNPTEEDFEQQRTARTRFLLEVERLGAFNGLGVMTLPPGGKGKLYDTFNRRGRCRGILLTAVRTDTGEAVAPKPDTFPYQGVVVEWVTINGHPIHIGNQPAPVSAFTSTAAIGYGLEIVVSETIRVGLHNCLDFPALVSGAVLVDEDRPVPAPRGRS